MASPIREIKVHKSPVACMIASPIFSVIVSSDSKGMIEYWDSASGTFPRQHVSFDMKSSTDLYDLLSINTVAYSMNFSPRGDTFVVLSRDKMIRVFNFKNGRICNKFDETINAYMLKNSMKSDPMNFSHC